LGEKNQLIIKQEALNLEAD